MLLELHHMEYNSVLLCAIFCHTIQTQIRGGRYGKNSNVKMNLIMLCNLFGHRMLEVVGGKLVILTAKVA